MAWYGSGVMLCHLIYSANTNDQQWKLYDKPNKIFYTDTELNLYEEDILFMLSFCFVWFVLGLHLSKSKLI